MKLFISIFFVLTTLISGFAAADSSAPATPAAATETRININTADAKSLSEKLDGIGDVKAQAIVDFRNTNGPFTSVADLGKVKGIGQRTLEANQTLMTVQ